MLQTNKIDTSFLKMYLVILICFFQLEFLYIWQVPPPFNPVLYQKVAEVQEEYKKALYWLLLLWKLLLKLFILQEITTTHQCTQEHSSCNGWVSHITFSEIAAVFGRFTKGDKAKTIAFV